MPKWTKPGVEVVQCADCGMRFVRSVALQFATADFYRNSGYHLSPDKLAGDFAPVRFERELRVFRRFCPAGDVLDVGCSTGAFLYQLKTRWPDRYSVFGTDVAVGPLEYAAAKGIEVIHGPFAGHEFGDQRFDAVTFWAVMEHLAEPRTFLTKAADILKIGGHCLILAPNAHSLAIRLLGSKYRYIMPEHLNYFTPGALRRFAALEPRFEMRHLTGMHFNPLVIWQDWKGPGELVSEPDRARLLKRTTALKQSPRRRPVKFLYHLCDRALSRLRLADNLVIVLQRTA